MTSVIAAIYPCDKTHNRWPCY